MNKLKIFLSSRVNSASNSDKLDRQFTLSELRGYLRDELEKEEFLGESILDVVINETNFKSTIAKDAFRNCMDTMLSCNMIIILYNGEAGWSITGNTSSNGICHEEFLVAVDKFSDMSFMINISGFFKLPEEGPFKLINDEFAKDVADTYGHMETIPATTIKELKDNLLKQCKQYILEAVQKSFITQKRVVSGSTVYGETLDWSKLNYPERHASLKAQSKALFDTLPAFDNVIKAYYAIPDHMSVADARNMIGRPFIYEHNFLDKDPGTSGVIHFVAVYGNATEIQVKNLVGYPDLTVIKAPFGFYLWEKNIHIQMFFLKACINPDTLKSRLTEVIIWLARSREQVKILKRAEARYSILEAINKTKKMRGF